MNEIINNCPYSSNINRMTFDQKILINVPYIMPDDYNNNGDNSCIDIQTLYNTVYNKENSYGSSYRYMVPPYLDNTPVINHKKKRTI